MFNRLSHPEGDRYIHRGRGVKGESTERRVFVGLSEGQKGKKGKDKTTTNTPVVNLWGIQRKREKRVKSGGNTSNK